MEQELKIFGTLDDVPISYKHSLSSMGSQPISSFAASASYVVALAGDRVYKLTAKNNGNEDEKGDKQLNNCEWSLCANIDPSLKIKQVACGNSHSLFLSEQGSVYSLGSNDRGQLGLGHASAINESEPAALVDVQNVTQVFCGPMTSAALTGEGQVFTWGDATYGKLGYWASSSDNVQLSPQQITGWDPSSKPPVIKEVSMGGLISCFLGASGILYVCGSAQKGEMALEPARAKAAGGNPLLKTVDGHVCISPPRLVDLPDPVRRIAAGTDYVLVVSKGRVLVWGNGERGTLGIGRREVIYEPYPLKKFRNEKIRQVFAAVNHSCAITDNRVLYTWGDEGQGQIGAKTENELLAPVETYLLRGYKCNQVAVGSTVTVCLCEKAERVDPSQRILGAEEDEGELKQPAAPREELHVDSAAQWRGNSHLVQWAVACAFLFVLLAVAVARFVL